jgi:hypothetical protein
VITEAAKYLGYRTTAGIRDLVTKKLLTPCSRGPRDQHIFDLELSADDPRAPHSGGEATKLASAASAASQRLHHDLNAPARSILVIGGVRPMLVEGQDVPVCSAGFVRRFIAGADTSDYRTAWGFA